MNINCPHCGTEYDINQRGFGKYVTCQVCGKGFVAVGVPPIKKRIVKSFHEPKTILNSFTETKWLKTWALYYLTKLLVVCAISIVVGFVIGFVASLSGCVPFFEWPQNGVHHRIGHVLVYVVSVLGICAALYLSWMCYKKLVVREVFSSCKVFNVLSSWLVPTLINVAVGLLMPADIQISVLGVYGYLVWCLTIWVVLDYCMFRFISIRILCGQRIDGRWICPALLFCILITIMYGVTNIIIGQAKSADKIYEALRLMDNSRHHDASQIYDRMGRMKLY